jgi:hypothetical protein
VPIEQKLNPAATDPEVVSAIENELPAYRAISPRAVFALILGILSVLSFASLYFLAVAVAAVLIGYLADRKIQRLPDVLTGRGLAQAGIGLGLIFGLTSTTISTVQSFVRGAQASAFARVYEDVLKNGTFDQLVWYGQPAPSRARASANEIVKAMTADPKNASMFEMKHEAHRKLKKVLATPNADVHFEKIETHGVDGLNYFAGALFEIHTPSAEKPTEREQFVLAVMKAAPGATGRYEWWVEDLKFPYKPSSFVAPEPEHKDDGHGHSH